MRATLDVSADAGDGVFSPSLACETNRVASRAENATKPPRPLGPSPRPPPPRRRSPLELAQSRSRPSPLLRAS